MQKQFKNPQLEIDEKGNPIFDKVKYPQVVVWEGTNINEEDINKFVEYIKTELRAEIIFLEVILTKSDKIDGIEVIDTGNRSDIFFAIDIKNSDIKFFSAERFSYDHMRWIEDALATENGYFNNPIYDDRVLEYRNWETKEKI